MKPLILVLLLSLTARGQDSVTVQVRLVSNERGAWVGLYDSAGVLIAGDSCIEGRILGDNLMRYRFDFSSKASQRAPSYTIGMWIGPEPEDSLIAARNGWRVGPVFWNHGKLLRQIEKDFPQ